MPAIDAFCRQVRSRSKEHQQAMRLLSDAGLAGQMVAILRQELDSMVRVIYLLAQPPDRRDVLIDASVKGEKWSQQNSKGAVTDKEMVHLAQRLQGWTLSVYKFGCAFIHLSSLHDYNDRDPLVQLPIEERDDILDVTTTAAQSQMSQTFATLFRIFRASLKKSPTIWSVTLSTWKTENSRVAMNHRGNYDGDLWKGKAQSCQWPKFFP